MKPLLSFCIGLLLPAAVMPQVEQQVRELAEKHFPERSYNGVVGIADTGSYMVVSFGYEEPEAAIPVSQYTPFSLASLTKSFTGLIVLHFIDQGVITPFDTIGTWFPELKPRLRKVTINQLANHTAAIHDFYSLTNDHEHLDDASALRLLTALDSTVYTPGSAYGYSNSHYLLLALLLERLSGKPFEDLVDELFLEPLHMEHTGFITQGLKPIPSRLQDGSKGGYRGRVNGESGIITTGSDMLAFGQGLLVDEHWTDLMLLGISLGHVYEKDTNWTYAYGWFCSEDEQGKFCAHSGKGFGYQAYHRWYYGKDVYYFLLANEERPAFKAFRDDVARLLPKRKK